MGACNETPWGYPTVRTGEGSRCLAPSRGDSSGALRDLDMCSKPVRGSYRIDPQYNPAKGHPHQEISALR
jgi:hypothetical protein